MGLPKGKTNNLKGRPKGSKNKVTKDTRGFIIEALEKVSETIIADLEGLSPKDRVSSFFKLLEFVEAKKRPVVVDERLSDYDFEMFKMYKKERERYDSMTEEELDEELRKLEKSVYGN
jgi:hypothetical protein